MKKFFILMAAALMMMGCSCGNQKAVAPVTEEVAVEEVAPAVEEAPATTDATVVVE